MTFHFVEDVKDVWDFALTNVKVDNPQEFEIFDTTDDEKKSE